MRRIPRLARSLCCSPPPPPPPRLRARRRCDGCGGAAGAPDVPVWEEVVSEVEEAVLAAEATAALGTRKYERGHFDGVIRG